MALLEKWYIRYLCVIECYIKSYIEALAISWPFEKATKSPIVQNVDI